MDRIFVIPLLASLFAASCGSNDAKPPPPPGATTQAPSSTHAPSTPRAQGLATVDTRSGGRSTSTADLAQPADPRRIEFLGLEAPTDPVWRWSPVRKPMRLHTWTVPAPEGSEPAELTMIHFAEAVGNTAEANVRRWTGQFRGDDLPPRPEVTPMTVAGTMVELRGEYLGMGGGWHKADHAMLVAMVESKDGSIFIKMLGPAATVDAARASFMAMVEGIRPSNR